MPGSISLDQVFLRLVPDADREAKKIVIDRIDEILKEISNSAEFSRYIVDGGMVYYAIGTSIGYFIIKLSDQDPVRQVRFDEVKDEIKAHLLQQRTDAEFGNWLEKQRKLADIRKVRSKKQ